jgi:hypothetical protein
MWSRAGLKPNLSLAPQQPDRSPKRVKGDFDLISFGWANEPMIDAYSLLVQVAALEERHFAACSTGAIGAIRASTR